MRRWLLVLLLLGCGLKAAAQLDTTGRYAGLDSLLTQFYGALVREEISVKNAEFDARSRDAIANLAGTFAQDGDEVARRRRLRMKAQAQEKAV